MWQQKNEQIKLKLFLMLSIIYFETMFWESVFIYEADMY